MAKWRDAAGARAVHEEEGDYDRDELVRQLEQEMLQARRAGFRAGRALRDHIKELKDSPELKVPAAQARPERAVCGATRANGNRTTSPQRTAQR